eukprot:s1543_g14.t5
MQESAACKAEIFFLTDLMVADGFLEKGSSVSQDYSWHCLSQPRCHLHMALCPAASAALPEASCPAPRVLCCLWGELRAVFKTAESLRDMVLDPLGAELLILGQRHFPDDEHRLNFLSEQGQVLHAEVYEKPEPDAFFGASHFENMSQVRGNWLNAGNAQVLINHKILFEKIKSNNLLEKYELFVFSRSDLLHLLPLPPAESLLRCIGRGDILTQAGHEFGGVNYNLAIMGRQAAESYLCAPFDTVVSRSLPNRQKTYNIELFWRVILGQRCLRNLRMPVTCFITAETVQDRTSWRKIKYNQENDVIFKYQSQMEEAFQNQAVWKQQPEWVVLRPPLGLQVREGRTASVPEALWRLYCCQVHGQARRLFGLHLAAVVPDRSVGSKHKEPKKMEAATAEGAEVVAEGAEAEEPGAQGSAEKNASITDAEKVRFHCVPRKGWDRYFRGMRCEARNVINWKGRGDPPEPPQKGCWLLPTSDEAAVAVAQQQDALNALGWRLVSSSPEVIMNLGNKVRLQDYAKARGLLEHLPKRYSSAEDAEYPCILKQAYGEFGKECCIVSCADEVFKVASHGLRSRWVLQELVRGCFEVSTTVLADKGNILDEISICYQYDSDAYVWPRCRRITKSLHSVPGKHLKVFEQFLAEYSGICNFNYKVRETGELSIFELNTRIGGDLAVDAPRDRACALFEKLDAHWCTACTDDVTQKKVREGALTKCEKYPAQLQHTPCIQDLHALGYQQGSPCQHSLFNSLLASMFGPKPEDPSDLSPPDELAQALSIWARHSAGAASRGAQAAAYARAQATIAHHMAYQAAQKIRELDENECVQKYSEEFERPAMEQSMSSPLLLGLVPRSVWRSAGSARRAKVCRLIGFL